MHSIALLMLVPATLASPWGWKGSWGGHWGYGHHQQRAAYFLDNDPAGASVVSLHIDDNGILSNPTRISTHGLGADGMNSTGSTNQADSLFSQDAVVLSGDMLFTINPGSNTIVMFRINPWDPYHPEMVGSPVDTMGQFPISLTYSEHLKTACVINGGSRAGVSCFHADPWHGLTAAGPIRSFGPGLINETTPATGPAGSASDIFFTPDSSAVIVTIKGDAGATPVKVGHFVTFPVNQEGVACEPILSQIPDVPMPFSATFLDTNRLFLSDPSYGVSILNVASNHQITELSHTKIPEQSAVCWTNYDASLGFAVAIDAGLPVLTKIDPSSGAISGRIMLNDDMKGVFDSKIQHQKLYSLVGANGVAVTDLVKEKQVQFLNLTSFGKRPHYQGMAVYPAM